jgi:enoyl-CoA hydratase/carnithine racemase
LTSSQFFSLHDHKHGFLLRLESIDGTNRLSCECVLSLQGCLEELRATPRPLVITGNEQIFSAGADLFEVASLNGPSAHDFAEMGQQLMRAIAEFPAPVYAAISGYCMGGGLDLALACHRRIASADAIFGHRGAALGLITGWGGTQRLPRLVGRAAALQMFLTAEKVNAQRALTIGLIEGIAEDPVAESFARIARNAAAGIP